MPLQQDLVSRIIKVAWPGGIMLVLFAAAGKFSFGISPPDPNIDIKLHSPALGWDHESLDSLSLTEQVLSHYVAATFTTSPNRLNSYAYFEERNSETNEQVFTILDRGRYGVQQEGSGTVVTEADNGSGGFAIPFTVDFSGNSAPDGDFPVFLSPPGDLFLIAEDQATVGGLPGLGWKPVLLEVLASHDELSSVTSKLLIRNRLVFINVSKFKADNPAAETLVIDVEYSFVGGTVEQVYGGVAQLGAYEKKVQAGLNEFTDGQPVAPDNVWPLVEGEPASEGANGFPNFFPPENPDNTRFPLDEPGWFEILGTGGGEGEAPPSLIRFTVTLEDFSIEAEVIFEF